MTDTVVYLDKVPVGDGYPVVFVAETGTFFNKDIDIAIDYVNKIAAAGVPVFKTEILHDPDICLAGTGLEHQYNHANGKAVEDYRALIERKIVSLNDYKKIFSACLKQGMPVIASVYDTIGVDFVKNNGGCALKIARNNIDNVPLIRCAAASKLPVIFDMGQVYLDEIAFAVRVAREAGATDLIVNLHPGANPAPANYHHLRTVNTIKSMFNIPVGLSCHYRGDEILYAAVGAGINLIEKGVDADPDRIEQDLVSALPLADLPDAIKKLQACWEALGNTEPLVEQNRDLTVRAGIYVKCDLDKGSVLTPEVLGWAWPPLGISAREWDRIINRKLNVSLKAGTPLQWKAIDFKDRDEK